MNKNEKKPFIINETTPIGFGKLKGQSHKELLSKKNSKYAKWIIDQGPEFRYKDTWAWIINNNKNKNKSNMDEDSDAFFEDDILDSITTEQLQNCLANRIT